MLRKDDDDDDEMRMMMTMRIGKTIHFDYPSIIYQNNQEVSSTMHHHQSKYIST